MSTDYDCWREAGEDVTGAMVFQVMQDNAAMAHDVLGKALAFLGSPGSLSPCRCREPLGVVTGHDKRDGVLMNSLEVVLRR